MSGPNDTDDGWAELARELGLEQPRPVPKPVEPPPLPPEPVAEFDRPAPPRLAESTGWDDAPTEDFAGCLVETEDSSEEADADSSDELEDGVEIVADGTGEPGEPKKKRRRRRRRRKKGPGEPGEAGEVADAPNGAEGEVESAEEETEDEEDEVSDPLQPVGEEAPSPEASRELIANWDVPSWETIIQTMLYRPGGR